MAWRWLIVNCSFLGAHWNKNNNSNIYKNINDDNIDNYDNYGDYDDGNYDVGVDDGDNDNDNRNVLKQYTNPGLNILKFNRHFIKQHVP